jgi:hypothetical protein
MHKIVKQIVVPKAIKLTALMYFVIIFLILGTNLVLSAFLLVITFVTKNMS